MRPAASGPLRVVAASMFVSSAVALAASNAAERGRIGAPAGRKPAHNYIGFRGPDGKGVFRGCNPPTTWAEYELEGAEWTEKGALSSAFR